MYFVFFCFFVFLFFFFKEEAILAFKTKRKKLNKEKLNEKFLILYNFLRTPPQNIKFFSWFVVDKNNARVVV
jgi:hypothetical protein